MLLIPSFTSYPAATERSLPCQLKSRAEVEEETLEVRQQQAEICSIICLMVQRPVLNTKIRQGTLFDADLFIFCRTSANQWRPQEGFISHPAGCSLPHSAGWGACHLPLTSRRGGRGGRVRYK